MKRKNDRSSAKSAPSGKRPKKVDSSKKPQQKKDNSNKLHKQQIRYLKTQLAKSNQMLEEQQQAMAELWDVALATLDIVQNVNQNEKPFIQPADEGIGVSALFVEN